MTDISNHFSLIGLTFYLFKPQAIFEESVLQSIQKREAVRDQDLISIGRITSSYA
jgi:hypothetical protein